MSLQSRLAELVAAIGADIKLLKTPVYTMLSRSANLAVAQGATVTIPWDVESFDPHGFHDPASPNDVTIPSGKGGLYAITAVIVWEANSGNNNRSVAIQYFSSQSNATVTLAENTVVANSTNYTRQVVSITGGFLLQPGDKLRVVVFNGSMVGAPASANILQVGAWAPAFHVVKLMGAA